MLHRQSVRDQDNGAKYHEYHKISGQRHSMLPRMQKIYRRLSATIKSSNACTYELNAIKPTTTLVMLLSTKCAIGSHKQGFQQRTASMKCRHVQLVRAWHLRATTYMFTMTKEDETFAKHLKGSFWAPYLVGFFVHVQS